MLIDVKHDRCTQQREGLNSEGASMLISLWGLFFNRRGFHDG